MVGRILLGLAIVLVIAIAALFALSWRPSIAPITPPSADSFPPELIKRGEMLAGAGNCVTCHTVPGGSANTGGLGLQTPFGVIYSPSLSPNPDSGIGRWSEQAFARAMRQGVARNGSHLFPVFPYTHFNIVTDEDMTALYAYFMSRPPEPAAPKAGTNTIPFPLNLRVLQIGWKWLYFRDRPFEPNVEENTLWNRGAYLAEGLAHCSACHTPRNRLGAERADAAYAGATIENWYAPALTAANPSALPWTEEELFEYLRSGGTALHGVAAGSMSEVIHMGLARVGDNDLRALAVYFADMGGAQARAGDTSRTVAQALASEQPGDAHITDSGAALYLNACAGCHYNSGTTPLLTRPELALNSAVRAPDPATLIQVVLHGIGRQDGVQGLIMPGFALALSDADIAGVANYLRRSRTDLEPWPDLEATVAKLRKEPGSAH